MNFNDKREPNRRPPTGPIRAGTGAPTSVLLRAVLAVALAAALLGLAVPPALAQSASASPDASAPSESTNSIQQEQTVQSGGEDSQGADPPEGETGRSGGLSVGGIHIDDNCVQNGPITIGDCGGAKKPAGNQQGSGDRPGGETGEDSNRPESTTPESTTPETTAPEDASPSPDDEASGDPSEDDPSEGASCSTQGPLQKTTEVTVQKVVDGDTAELSEPVKGTTTVRFIGVDTPETVDPEEEPEPFGEEASTFTERALEGESIALEFDRDAKDQYDRLLAYPWTEDEEGNPLMFSEALLEGGYGELMVIDPNDAYEECLAAAEARAKESGAGIWGLGDGSGPDTDTDADPAPADEPQASPEPSEDPTEAPTEDDPNAASPEAEEPQAEEPETAAPDASLEASPEASAPPVEPANEPNAAEEPSGEEPAVEEPATEEPSTDAFGAPQSAPEEVPEAITSPPDDLAFGETPGSAPAADPSPTTDQYTTDTGIPPGEPEIVLPDSGGRDLASATAPAGPRTMAAAALIAAGAAFLSADAVRRRKAGRAR